MRMNKGSTEWSYREGIECGNAWLGMNGGRFGELVKWTRADCSDRIPLETFVERHLDGVIEEAEEQGEYFDCGRFVRGFHYAVLSARAQPEAISSLVRIVAGVFADMEGDGAMGHTQAGINLANAGLWDDAIAEYDEAIRRDPGMPATFLHRGLAYYHSGDPPQGLQDIDEAIRQDPQNAVAYYWRGIVHSSFRGDAREVLSYFDKAVHLDPGNAAALFERGSTHMRLGHHALALDDLNEVIRLNPWHAYAFAYRAKVLTRLSRDYEAQSDAKTAITLGYDSARLESDLGLAKTIREAMIQ